MDNTTHYQKLEKMYLKANINTDLYDSTTVSIKEGYSEVGLTIISSSSLESGSTTKLLLLSTFNLE